MFSDPLLGLLSLQVPDANDNATAISDPIHTTNQSFDALGRVISTTQDVGGLAMPTSYQYNALDQVTQSAIFSERRCDFSRGRANHVSTHE